MKQLLVLSIAFFFVLPAFAQKQRKSPHDTITTKDISVTYGRPYKNGRVIFGVTEPFGKVWRVGADEATEITFAKDVTFNGKALKAGTYTLFAIPNEKEWTIILNSQLKQWGAFGYEKVKDKDVLQTTVPVKALNTTVEQLTIRFDKGNMYIEWDNTQVLVAIR